MLTDLFKEDFLQCLENLNWSQLQAATVGTESSHTLSFLSVFAAEHTLPDTSGKFSYRFQSHLEPASQRAEHPKAQCWAVLTQFSKGQACVLTFLVFISFHSPKEQLKIDIHCIGKILLV